MYNHLTNEELLRVPPASKLEIELQTRLDCCLELLIQVDESDVATQNEVDELLEYRKFVDKLKDAIRPIATEIHRCANGHGININNDFIVHCQQFIDEIDELIAYPLPQGSELFLWCLNEVRHAN